MNEVPNSLLATDESAPVISAGRYGLYEKNGNLLIEKHFVLPPQAVMTPSASQVSPLSRAHTLRPRHEQRPRAGGGRPTVYGDARVYPADRGQGAAEAQAPEPIKRTQELPQ